MTPPHHRPWQPAALQGLAVSVSVAGGAPLVELDFEWREGYRLITSEYAGENVFDRLAPDAAAEDLRRLADLTNPVVQEMVGRAALVAPEDRPVGPGRGLVLAAFAHPAAPTRFSTGEWGVFYAAGDEGTAVAETVYHRTRILAGSGPTTLDMVALVAWIAGVCVDVRAPHPAPPDIYLPADYQPSQRFGKALHRAKADGVAYDSVRRPSGAYVAVFRPAIVLACAARHRRIYAWDGERIAVR